MKPSATPPPVEKLCVFCEHWQFDGGSAGYSELTPGTEASMNCGKGHYGRGFTLVDMGGEDAFRAQILIARSCKDYKQVKP